MQPHHGQALARKSCLYFQLFLMGGGIDGRQQEFFYPLFKSSLDYGGSIGIKFGQINMGMTVDQGHFAGKNPEFKLLPIKPMPIVLFSEDTKPFL
jgi:hypothetical protein